MPDRPESVSGTASVEKTPEPSRALKPASCAMAYMIRLDSRKDPRALTGAETRVIAEGVAVGCQP